MNIEVKFFEGNLTKAIGAGIYGIYAEHNGKRELLYIGESVFVLVRCATHLYEIAKGIGYLGFSQEKLNEDIIIEFELLLEENNRGVRKAKEKEKIKDMHPIMQSGISDRVKPVEEMIDALVKMLE